MFDFLILFLVSLILLLGVSFVLTVFLFLISRLLSLGPRILLDDISVGETLTPFSFFIRFNVICLDFMKLLLVNLFIVIGVRHIQQVFNDLILGLASDELCF